MEKITTIPRELLVKVTEQLIVDHPELPEVWADDLREVARTIPRIRGDYEWWDIHTECGCLVGSITHGHPQDAFRSAGLWGELTRADGWAGWMSREFEALVQLGADYPVELRGVLHDAYGEVGSVGRVLEVLDA